MSIDSESKKNLRDGGFRINQQKWLRFNFWLHDATRRLFDILFSLGALAFFFPVLVLVSALIWVLDGRPIFYAQKRVGKDGQTFKCYKFRTMVTNADQVLSNLLKNDESFLDEWKSRQKLTHDPRVSRFGTFLRKTSLDELPQFWNVILGDMSVVGPRPIVLDEVSRYGDRIRYYSSVRPGITGLWQISGRSNTSYEDRVQLDCEYISSRNIYLDLFIIFNTIKVVLRREGAE